MVSIGPILAVPGMREAVRASPAPVVGFAGILGGAPVLGMAQHLLPAIGVEVDAAAVGEHYGSRTGEGVLDVWAMDGADAGSADRVRAAGLRPVVTDLIMSDPEATATFISYAVKSGTACARRSDLQPRLLFTIFAPDGIAEITAGDDLAAIVLDAVHADPQGPLLDGDIVVITSKIVSKAEGRVVPAADREAMINAETVRTVARRGATAIVRDPGRAHPCGRGRRPVQRGALRGAAAAGGPRCVRRPAARGAGGADRPPPRRDRLRHRRPGLANRPDRPGDRGVRGAGRPSYAGLSDGYGNPLRITAMALADELAGAADLVKGKLDGRPVAVVRGLSGLVGDPGGTAAELVRPAAEDLFPLGSREAVLAAALIAAGRADAYEEVVGLDAAERAAAVVRLVGVEGPAAELLMRMLSADLSDPAALSPPG